MDRRAVCWCGWGVGVAGRKGGLFIGFCFGGVLGGR